MDRKVLWDQEDVVALVFNLRMSRNDRQGYVRIDLVDMSYAKCIVQSNFSANGVLSRSEKSC
jgi:hypothetical protein